MKRSTFISSGTLGTFALGSLLTETFAESIHEDPRAITNKINKKPLKPFYIKPDNSPTYEGGAKVRFDQVNNQFASFEFVLPPKMMGPAPHIHNDLDEIMRVIEGTVSVLVGDEVFQVEAGGWHLRPHGIPHTFWNAGDGPATFIDFYPNQNFEVCLGEMEKLLIQLEKKGVVTDSKEWRGHFDKLLAEWGIIMYYDQRVPIMEKHGLKG